MDGIEGLGVFYLGRPYDLATQTPQDEPLLYDSKDLVDARGLRRHDRQRQDRPLHRAARGGGASTASRRSSIDPKGDLGNLLLTFPELRARGLPAVDRRGRRRAQGRHARRVRGADRPSAGRRAWPSGARTARASRACATPPTSRSTRPAADAGLPLSILQLVRRAAAAMRDDAEALRERVAPTVVGPARPARHRRRPDQEPRAHPARRRSSTRAWQRGPATSTCAALIRADPDAAVRQGRRARPRDVLPGEGPLRAGDAAQQPARLARLRRLAGGRAARRRSGCCYTPEGKPRVSIFSIAHLADAERMFFVTLLLNEVLGWMRDAVGHDEPARDPLHGRDLRLLPAGREPAVEAAAADAAQAGARLRPGRRAGDAEPGRPRLQGARRTPAPGSSAGCRPSATRRACSTGSKGAAGAGGVRPRRDGADRSPASASACS